MLGIGDDLNILYLKNFWDSSFVDFLLFCFCFVCGVCDFFVLVVEIG